MTIWSSPVVFASLPGASQELLGKSAEAVHGPTFFAFPVLTTVLIQGWLRAASVLCVVPVLRGGEKQISRRWAGSLPQAVSSLHPTLPPKPSSPRVVLCIF